CSQLGRNQSRAESKESEAVSLPVVFRRAAREELEEAHDWYEKQRAGLGEQLEEAVQQVLDRIAATPMMHQCIHKDIRRGLVPGFPKYTILYRVLSKHIRVIAVFHASRDPKIWQSRT